MPPTTFSMEHMTRYYAADSEVSKIDKVNVLFQSSNLNLTTNDINCSSTLAVSRELRSGGKCSWSAFSSSEDACKENTLLRESNKRKFRDNESSLSDFEEEMCSSKKNASVKKRRILQSSTNMKKKNLRKTKLSKTVNQIRTPKLTRGDGRNKNKAENCKVVYSASFALTTD